jgi:hypothetical protein
MKTKSKSQHPCFHRKSLLLTVVTSHETKSVVDKVSGKTNEATRDRVRGRHLGDTVVHQTEEASIDRIGQEQACWAALVETAANGHEESSSNGAANSHQLNLSISKASVKVVIVLNNLTLFVAVDASDRRRRHEVVDLLSMFERGHVASREKG